MTTLMTNQANNVISFKLKDFPKTMSLKVDGTDLHTISLVTGVSYGLSGNYQFLHTVNNFIYLYAFGDRISTINITGLAALKTCAENPKTIAKIYDFYKANRVAKKKNAMRIVVNGRGGGEMNLRFFGYLTGMTLDIKNTESLGNIAFWNMRFEAVILGG